MKKIAITLSCMLVCLTLFSGCTNQKDSDSQDTNVGNSVEVDDADFEVNAEGQPDADDYSDSVDLPDGFTYSFKDPDNADGIVVTPRK